MKNTFIMIALVLLPFISKAQQENDTASDFPKPFQFQMIDSSVKGTRSELFTKANEWVVKTFVSAKDVIQMSDKDAGKIVVKGLMETTSKFGLGRSKFYTKFTLSIDVKDNKCRVKISDFIVEQYHVVSTISNNDTRDVNASLDDDKGPRVGMSGFPQKTWDNIKPDCSDQSNILMKNAITAMKSKSDTW